MNAEAEVVEQAASGSTVKVKPPITGRRLANLQLRARWRTVGKGYLTHRTTGQIIKAEKDDTPHKWRKKKRRILRHIKAALPEYAA